MIEYIEDHGRGDYECLQCRLRGVYPRDTARHVFPDMPAGPGAAALRAARQSADTMRVWLELLNDLLQACAPEKKEKPPTCEEEEEDEGLPLTEDELDEYAPLLVAEHDLFFCEVAVRARRALAANHAAGLQLARVKPDASDAELAFHVADYRLRFLNAVVCDAPMLEMKASTKRLFRRALRAADALAALPADAAALPSDAARAAAARVLDRTGGVSHADLAAGLAALPLRCAATRLLALDTAVLRACTPLLRAPGLPFLEPVTRERHARVLAQLPAAERFIDDPWNAPDFELSTRLRNRMLLKVFVVMPIALAVTTFSAAKIWQFTTDWWARELSFWRAFFPGPLLRVVHAVSH